MKEPVDLESQLKAVIDTVVDGIITIDAKGVIRSFNPAAERMFGYAAAEVIGKNISTLTPEPHRSHHDEYLQRYLTTGERKIIGIGREVEGVRKDGSRFPLELSVSEMSVGGERMFTGITRDISARKRAEAERDRFFELSLDLLCVASPDGFFRRVNPSFTRVLGYSEAELLARPFADFIHPDDVPATFAEVERLAKGATTIDFANRYRCADGSYRTLLWAATPDPATGLLHASARDVTEQRARERVTADLASQLKAVIDTVVDGIITIDAKGVICSFNPAAERIFGYSAQEAIGRNISTLTPEPHRSHNDEYLQRYLTTGERKIIGIGREVEGVRKDGARFPLELSVSEMSVGGERMFTGVTRDISERKATEEALASKHQALGAAINELEAFSYSVSHDLRQPLRSIDGFSLALLEDFGDTLPASARSLLQRVRAGAQRMAQLIDDLLDLSRISRAELALEPVDLSGLVGTVWQDVRSQDPSRDVSFTVAEGILGRADPRLLRVALENLIGNAWKFTRKKPGARIEFGALEQNGQPVYFVRDDGAGFDMAYSAKLFGAFQRLHSARDFEGTGIGLVTVARVVHRHGGRVWAEGAVEQGAAFFFTLGEAREAVRLEV